MLNRERWALKDIQWLNDTCSMIQWSQLISFRPLTQTSDHGLWPHRSVLKITASA